MKPKEIREYAKMMAEEGITTLQLGDVTIVLPPSRPPAGTTTFNGEQGTPRLTDEEREEIRTYGVPRSLLNRIRNV